MQSSKPLMNCFVASWLSPTGLCRHPRNNSRQGKAQLRPLEKASVSEAKPSLQGLLVCRYSSLCLPDFMSVKTKKSTDAATANFSTGN